MTLGEHAPTSMFVLSHPFDSRPCAEFRVVRVCHGPYFDRRPAIRWLQTPVPRELGTAGAPSGGDAGAGVVRRQAVSCAGSCAAPSPEADCSAAESCAALCAPPAHQAMRVRCAMLSTCLSAPADIRSAGAIAARWGGWSCAAPSPQADRSEANLCAGLCALPSHEAMRRALRRALRRPKVAPDRAMSRALNLPLSPGCHPLSRPRSRPDIDARRALRVATGVALESGRHTGGRQWHRPSLGRLGNGIDAGIDGARLPAGDVADRSSGSGGQLPGGHGQVGDVDTTNPANVQIAAGGIVHIARYGRPAAGIRTTGRPMWTNAMSRSSVQMSTSRPARSPHPHRTPGPRRIWTTPGGAERGQVA